MKQDNALIKSKQDLNYYLENDNKAFPINKLNDKDKSVFINSLEFNNDGLTTFNYSVLKNLNESEIYSILSLFGFEDSYKLIKKPTESSPASNKLYGESGSFLDDARCVATSGAKSCLTWPGYACSSKCS